MIYRIIIVGEALQGKEIGIEDVIVIDTGTVFSLLVFHNFIWIDVDVNLVIEKAFIFFSLYICVLFFNFFCLWRCILAPGSRISNKSQFSYNYMILGKLWAFLSADMNELYWKLFLNLLIATHTPYNLSKLYLCFHFGIQNHLWYRTVSYSKI